MPAPIIILAALSLLASAPVSATPVAIEPQLAREMPTCEGKEQDSKFTFSTPSGIYDIICGNDYFGGDLTSSTADTFEACLLDCDKTDGCISVSYQGSACYMKNDPKTAVAAPLVTTAKKQGASTSPSTPPKDSSLTCDNLASDNTIYEAANGKFKIICGKDYAGGDLKSVSVARFEDCIKACDTTDECIDVSYVNGACYLKRSTATLVTADWVWTAVRQDSNNNAISCVDKVSNGATYTAKTGGSYKIECGLDYAGGDMQSLDTATIELCMDACDRADGCVDVSFVYGTCYLKNVVNGNGTPAGHVWTGRQVKTPEQAALQYLEANGGAFCSSFIAYEPPITVIHSTTTPGASTVTSTATSLTTSVIQLTVTVTSVATTTLPRAPLRKRAEATPSPISAWPASRISSACSKIATGISTSVSVATASVDPTTAVTTVISVIRTTATTTTTQFTTVTTAAEPRMTLGVNTGFENGNLNDWRQTQQYSNQMSPSIVNFGDNSPRSLQLSHNGGSISRVFLSQPIPASAVDKWFRVEFSTMYTRDNGQSDINCHQTFTWNGRVQGTIFATTGLLAGTSKNSMPNTRCSERTTPDNIVPRPRPGVWSRHTAWFQAKNLGGRFYDLELTARCDGGAPAQSLYFDNIRVVEDDC